MRTTVRGLDAAIEELRDIERGVPARVAEELDRALYSTFLDTQAATHVLTGSLKASGRMFSTVDGDVWEGEITYGGPSVPRDVDYSIYEEQRHPFMPGYEADERIDRILRSAG